MSESSYEFGVPKKRPPGRLVMPDVVTARRVGLTNVLFASLLLVACNLFAGLTVLISPFSQRMSQRIAKPMMKSMGETIQNNIKAIVKREANETNPSDKAKLIRQRQEMEHSLAATRIPMDMGAGNLQNGMVRNAMLADVVLLTGLNIAMLFSGVGLLHLKSWGRTTAMAVAGLKLVRVVIVSFWTAVWYIPAEVARTAKQLDAANMGNAAAGGMAITPQMIAALWYSVVFVSAVVATLYSLTILFFLWKPAVRVACEAASPVPENYLS